MSKKLDAAVITAASACMTATMVQAHENGKDDWQERDLCTREELSSMFFKALRCQKLISAMNYLMMLWWRKEEVCLEDARSNDYEADVRGLLLYYNAHSMEELVVRQSERIARLQKMLPDVTHEEPKTPRAG